MSPEALEIASNFILDAPPGELQDVRADIESLLGDDASLIEELTPAIEQYNKEQLVSVVLPGGSQRVIVSEYNELPDGRYFDVESQSSWAFDHVTQKASAVQTYTLESKHADIIKSAVRSLSTHLSEHYPALPSSGIYPSTDDSTIAVVIVGNKYSPSNFWNGRWRSFFQFDPSNGSLTGTIKVDVHYYEDGNVRLLTKKSVEAQLGSGASGAELVKAVAAEEKKYQEELNREFVKLAEGTFKGLRRQLPVTRQKIDWEKIGTYKLGQDIGGGRNNDGGKDNECGRQ
ncbi:F-actin capping protein alpha subunit [Ascodesmis nigricans]|uniref:F-actin-capping protein subunit alpha n=1 Tax=Ascodesmis nigricans TaxID=341454 RepID=A0A4S2N5Q7_9PEZI|nr:F-actin capping protein alpha subunit [Ascodesmis nigricans]